MKKYDAALEELRGHPKYGDAWETARAEARKRDVYECVGKRLRKEGVRPLIPCGTRFPDRGRPYNLGPELRA
jgi:hypothetical protein